MTGFSGDGKRITFFLPDGKSYSTRRIYEEEVMKFAVAPLTLAAVTLITTMLLPRGTEDVSLKILAEQFDSTSCFVAFVLLLSTLARGVGWVELLLLFGATILFKLLSTHGFQGLLTPAALGAIVPIAIALGVRIADMITRIVWEPFVLSVVLIVLVLVAGAFPTIPPRTIFVVCVLFTLFSILFSLSLFASCGANENGLSAIHDGGD